MILKYLVAQESFVLRNGSGILSLEEMMLAEAKGILDRADVLQIIYLLSGAFWGGGRMPV